MAVGSEKPALDLDPPCCGSGSEKAGGSDVNKPVTSIPGGSFDNSAQCRRHTVRGQCGGMAWQPGQLETFPLLPALTHLPPHLHFSTARTHPPSAMLSILRKARLKDQEMRVLMLGLDNAGKTTIVKHIMGEDVNTVSPTLGFIIKTIDYKG